MASRRISATFEPLCVFGGGFFLLICRKNSPLYTENVFKNKYCVVEGFTVREKILLISLVQNLVAFMLHVALKVLLISSSTSFVSFQPFPVTIVCLMSQTCLTHVCLCFPASCCLAALTALTWRVPGQHTCHKVMICGLGGLVVLDRPFSATT